jgi:hypothetical protein
MTVWQVDFYRRPLVDESGNSLWELVVCDPDRNVTTEAFCSQSEAKPTWIADQLQRLVNTSGNLPEQIQVFRPQSVSLIQAACQPLGIPVEPTRHTPGLKQVLQERVAHYRSMPNYTGQPYDPLALEKPPPTPLPENLWGEQWRFAAIAAMDLVPVIQNRPIPILAMPASLLPVQLQIPSTTLIPGVVIDGGRQSMQLARWLQRVRPVALQYIPGEPDGLILEAGLVERWVLTTFDDKEVIVAARTFRERLDASKGLHFLLVQPDNSGMTYSGFWLLKLED